MSLKEYDVEVNGHATTLQLSDEDARAYGLHVPAHRSPADEPAAEVPAEDQLAANEPDEPEADAEAGPVVDEPETKAAAPANKARTAANKGGNAR